jgi:hypothetical protein
MFAKKKFHEEKNKKKSNPLPGISLFQLFAKEHGLPRGVRSSVFK